VDDQPEFIQPLRDFLAGEAPAERVRRDDEAHNPPTDLLEKMGALGYLSVGLPEEWGGAGGLMEIVHLMVEVGRAYLGLGHLVGRTIYAQQLLLHFGTAAQQQEWIPRLRAGSAVFCVAITEPDAGSDAASVRTQAVRDGDDYVINGQKLYSSSMGYADIALVLTRTSTESRKQRGLTTFLVDPKSPGIEARRLEMLGDWTTGTYETFLTDVRVSANMAVGEIGDGWRVISGHLTRERLIMAARAIGATQALLDEATGYVRMRKQFGHAIADFQVIRHRLADMYIQLRVARSALFDVASQATGGEAVATDAAAIKIYASEMYVQAANNAMQMMGGYGYTRESDVQRHLRDARVYVVGGGSSEVLRDVVARELLRRAADAV